jgi:anti-sigma regulatory factor (Ser/Thr protein kinase)
VTTAVSHLEHAVALYRGSAGYLRSVRAFALGGVDGDAAPVFVASASRNIALLRRVLDGRRAPVAFHDVRELARNPARIIPAALAFAEKYSGRSVWCIWEPTWPERSAAELCEVARHEAAVNVALEQTAVRVLCPYDVAGLPSAFISQIRCTHPFVLEDGRQQASPEYLGQGLIPPACQRPLAAPPASAERLTYESDLRPVRTLVAATAARAGLSAMRSSDLVLAVGELAANTLRHAGSPGVLHAWLTPGEVLCQVHDDGIIADRMAGFRRKPADAFGGHGLWLVNQVCDLVELRSHEPGKGTTVRIHMRRPDR